MQIPSREKFSVRKLLQSFHTFMVAEKEISREEINFIVILRRDKKKYGNFYLFHILRNFYVRACEIFCGACYDERGIKITLKDARDEK